MKLDAMENPVSAAGRRCAASSASVLARVAAQPLSRARRAAAAASCIRRSDGACPQGMEMLLGNGSDELIQIDLARARAPGRGRDVPGAVLRDVPHERDRSCGMRYVGVPLRDDFTLDADALHRARCDGAQPALVFIAYPNNPDRQSLSARPTSLRSRRAAPGLVVRRRGLPRVRRQDASCGELAKYPEPAS